MKWFWYCIAGSFSFDEYNKLSKAGKTLIDGISLAGARVLGSPQSFSKLRSLALAPTTVFGHYTCMITLNPSERCSEWTFRMSGVDFVFDAFGNPVNKPSLYESLKLVARNFMASAKYIHAYFSAFCEVFLGWPMTSDRQVISGKNIINAERWQFLMTSCCV